MARTSSQPFQPHSLGTRIADARRKLGVREGKDVTVPDLAQRVGITAASVYTWEADTAVPSEANLKKVADVLGVTAPYLRYGVVEHANSVTMRPEIVAGRGSPAEPITEPAKDRKKKA